MNPVRLVVLNTHPIQYFTPFYKVLDQSPLIDATVLYLSDFSIRGGRDAGFGVDVAWDVDLLAGYRSGFVGGRAGGRTPGGFFSLVAPELWGELTSGRYDAVLVHGHNFAANWIALGAARAAGLTTLVRGDSHPDLARGALKAAIRRPIVRTFYRLCDRCLAIGSRNAQFYRDLGVPDDRIVLAPFAVDNERFASAASAEAAAGRARTRAALNIPPEAPAILFVGKFNHQKRPGDLVEAAIRLRSSGATDFRLVLCGAGELDGELRRRCAEAGFDNAVFTGFVNQSALPDIYAACDVFALSAGGEEPWGLVVNEAMAAGLPVVVSRSVGCAVDLVTDGVNGFAPEAGDIDAWTAALGRLVEDPELRAAQGLASAERISRWSYRECLDGFHRALAGRPVPVATSPLLTSRGWARMSNLSLSLHAGIERALGRSLTWRLGRWLYLGSRRELINDPSLNGEYALQGWLLDAMARRGAADQGPVFMDVGANVGDWVEHLAREINRRGLTGVAVHAFEPAPAQRATLSARLAALKLGGNLEVDARGVGAAPARARLVVRGERAGSNGLVVDGSGDAADGETVEVEIATLDQVCAERGCGGLFLVKVDTEGNDFNVIRGARGLFEAEAIGALQFEYNWRWLQFGHAMRDVFHEFHHSNYYISKLTADGIELYEEWHPELDRYTETNYLILHERLLSDVPHWWGRFNRFNALPGGAPSRKPDDGAGTASSWP